MPAFQIYIRVCSISYFDPIRIVIIFVGDTSFVICKKFREGEFSNELRAEGLKEKCYYYYVVHVSDRLKVLLAVNEFTWDRGLIAQSFLSIKR